MKAGSKKSMSPPVEGKVQEALAWLTRKSSRAIRDGMSRYAIPSANALGVAMRDIKALGRQLGSNQETGRRALGNGRL